MARREMGSTASFKSVETNVEELANQVSQLIIYVTSLEGMKNTGEDEKALAPDKALADLQMRDYVRDAIEKLPEQDRTIVTLYYFHDYSLEEVGKKLGYPDPGHHEGTRKPLISWVGSFRNGQDLE